MIANAQTLAQGGPNRVLVLKSWYKIKIQVNGPNTIFIGTSKDEAGRNTQGLTQDGLQLNNVNASIPLEIWWKGELWASCNVPATFIIVIPGLSPEIFQAGGGDSCEP